MNRTYIKPDHQSALEADAQQLGVNPTDVLDAILGDFFRGWNKPEDRLKFYRQVVTDRKSIIVTPDGARLLKELLEPELRSVRMMDSEPARRAAHVIGQLVEQL